MLYSTFDLITQATSSHLCVFCFFNVIIVMIFMVSKHEFNLDKDCEMHLPSPAKYEQDVEVVEHSVDDGNEQATKASEVVLCVYDKTVVTADSEASEEDYSDNNINTDDKDENYEEGEDDDDKDENYEEGEDDDDNDELRQRIEEFIAKVNREWRAEMLNDE